VLESVPNFDLDYNYAQSHGCRSRDFPEQHVGGCLHDRGEYADVFTGVGHLLDCAECDHLRYNQRRGDLLHDQRINPDNVIYVVLEPVLDPGFGDDNRQGNRRRKRNFTECSGFRGIHHHGPLISAWQRELLKVSPREKAKAFLSLDCREIILGY
jgi:hypothetical protein